MGSERSEQAICIAEVMRRCGMANAGALCDGAQREGLNAALGQFRLCRFQKRPAQIPVMVSLFIAHDSLE